MTAPLDRLVEVTGENACRSLCQAKRFSERRLAEVKAAIESSPGYRPELGWIVMGSLGRLEALGASDIDLVLLVPDGHDPGHPDTVALDQRVRDHVRAHVRDETGAEVKVSKGENLTSPTSARTIADAAKIGGDDDSVQLLTKRILLLTESRVVLNPELCEQVRKAVFNAYFESVVTKGKHMLSLINDVVRYYRTVCVDYKHRVDAENKAWAVRNMKLRHSRKVWFFSSMLAMISSAVKFNGHSPDEAETDTRRLFDASPVERLIEVLERAGLLRQQPDIFAYYDTYLGWIGDRGVRTRLEPVRHEKRHESEDYRRLADNSDKLHRAMLELIAALPPNWRRHMLSHFLL